MAKETSWRLYQDCTRYKRIRLFEQTRKKLSKSSARGRGDVCTQPRCQELFLFHEVKRRELCEDLRGRHKTDSRAPKYPSLPSSNGVEDQFLAVMKTMKRRGQDCMRGTVIEVERRGGKAIMCFACMLWSSLATLRRKCRSERWCEGHAKSTRK